MSLTPAAAAHTAIPDASRIASTGEERNKLAHWIWGTNDNPDTLLLIDPRAVVRSQASYQTLVSSPTSMPVSPEALVERQAHMAETMMTMLDSVLEYNEQDFKEIESRISERLGDIIRFFRKVNAELRSRGT